MSRSRSSSPRRERFVEILLGRVRPTHREQCLVRLRALQPHSLQHLLRVFGTIGFEPREAEREIGLVTQRRELFGRRRDLADFIQQLGRFLDALLANQRDADVEARIRRPDIAAGHRPAASAPTHESLRHSG